MKRLLTLVFLMATVALEAQTVRLAYNPVPGRVYTFNAQMTQEVNMNVPMVGEMKTTSLQDFSFTAKALSQCDTGFVMECVLTRLLIDSQGAGQHLVYSSEGNDLIGGAIAQLMNRPFTVVIAPNGNVSVPPLEDSFFEPAVEALSTLSKRKKESNLNTIKAFFEPKSLEGFVSMAITKFPDKDLKVPSLWQEDETVEALRATATSQYRLTEIDNNIATLAIKMVIVEDSSLPASTEPQRMEGIGGSGEGTEKVDMATGWVIEGTAKQNLTGSMVFEQRGQSTSIPLTVVITTTVNQVE